VLRPGVGVGGLKPWFAVVDRVREGMGIGIRGGPNIFCHSEERAGAKAPVLDEESHFVYHLIGLCTI
jgi:hypothetical protein